MWSRPGTFSAERDKDGSQADGGFLGCEITDPAASTASPSTVPRSPVDSAFSLRRNWLLGGNILDSSNFPSTGRYPFFCITSQQ
jgi:hypothetical protein